jgi:hypothetical protein
MDPVLIKEIQFEISCATREMLVQTSYDAMSFYICVIPKLALARLDSWKFGVSKLTTLTSAKTLEPEES